MTAVIPNTYPKRLIEVDLPIRRISAHARREKSIRHGHISTLHIWWARRPLAACRAVICAALWPDPVDENCPPAFIGAAKQAMHDWGRSNLKLCSAESMPHFVAATKVPAQFDDPLRLRTLLLDFIADFADWDNATIPEYLDTSRRLTGAAHESLGGIVGTRPLVVDPFAGGGSIPLEALRVGADAFASDLNPVAVILNKVVLEYVPRYGQRLADEVRSRGEWIKAELERRLRTIYPPETDGSPPVGFLWARTILSESPSEDDTPVELPVLRSMWLSSKPKRRFAFRWVRDGRGHIRTEIAMVSYADGTRRKVKRPLLEIFQPDGKTEIDQGTSSGGAVTCPITGYTTPVERVREQLAARTGGGSDARLLCVISAPKNASGRVYRLPAAADFAAIDLAAALLKERIAQPAQEVSLIPDGKLNHLRGFFNVVLYGMTTWGDLFTPRQALALCEVVELIKAAALERQEPEFSVAVQTCLAMALGRCADKCASVVVWNIPAEKIEHVFGRQALPMVWDFAEANLLSDIGWSGACEWVQRVVEHIAHSDMKAGSASQASATAQLLPDDSAEAVITDPPYYAAIPYADLSDFFYSWMKRSLGSVHPDLLSADLAPKDDECVQLSHRAAMYRNKDAAWFERTMALACTENRRVAKPSGISVVVFANKETSGWEAMLAALISSGWIITASWPIDTERAGRLRAMNSAALASSVHLVCRPREASDGSLRSADIGDWRDILVELPRRIHEWMPRLVEEGVVGADAIFACLGPALEIFSRYSRVERASGEQVTLSEYLEHVWASVSKEALSKIFEGASTEGFEPDARLTAMWLWTLAAPAGGSDDRGHEAEQDEEEDESGPKKSKAGYVLEFDAARKIAQGLGATIEGLGNLVKITGDKARLLPVSERTQYLFGKEQAGAPSAKKKKKPQLDMFAELTQGSDPEAAWGEKAVSKPGQTTLDRIHQSMILFAAGRGEALKRFLLEDGAGRDQRFWRLAQALSALYPPTTDEKRWVDGVLARKKGLGL